MSLFDALPPWALLAAAGVATSFSSKAREFLFRAFSYAIDRQVVPGQAACDMVLEWLRKNARQIGFRKSYVLYRSGERVLIPNLEGDTTAPSYAHLYRYAVAVIAGSVESPSMVFVYKGAPVWVTVKAFGGRVTSLTITTIRGQIPVARILMEASDYCANESRKSLVSDLGTSAPNYSDYRVIRVFGQGSMQEPGGTNPRAKARKADGEGLSANGDSGSGMDHDEFMLFSRGYHNLAVPIRDSDFRPVTSISDYASSDPTQALVLSSEAEGLLADIDFMLRNRSFFSSRDIPWKIGALLHGPPGTGKTSLIRAIGMKYGIPVISFDISSFTNSEFHRVWTEMSLEFPVKIMVLEDFDSVFHGRENVAEKSALRDALTFDAVLNTIDGLDNTTSGTILFVTTNNVKALDDAIGCYQAPNNGRWLPTRPGRIDVVVELGLIGEEGKLKIADRILRGMPESLTTEAMSSTPTPCSPATVQNTCRELARKHIFRAKAEEARRDP